MRRDRRSRGRTGRIVLPASLALVAWGTLAFGAVYPWAYRPLALAAAAVGASALVQAARRGRLRSDDGPLLAALGAILLGAIIQTIPLAPGLRTALSPASESFFRLYDPAYRLAWEARQGTAPLVAALAPEQLPLRPLSLNAGSTWRGIMLLAAYGLLLAGLSRTFARTGITRFAWWLVIFGAIVAAIGILQKAILGDHAYGGMRIYGFWEPIYKLTTPFGPYVNKNHYAGWMLMVLPVALGYLGGLAARGLETNTTWRQRLLWLSSEAGGRTQLAAMAIGLMSVALVMTLSRSGIAGFLMALTVMTVIGGRRLTTGRTRAALVLAVVILLASVWQWSAVSVASRFGTVPEAVALRLHAWHDATSIVRDFPLTGTGLNTYAAATTKYQTGDRTLHFREAHNDYLQLAAEGGLLLGLPILLAVGSTVILISRRLREPGDTLSTWTRTGLATGLIAIALQSAVEFSLQMPGNALVFVTLVAMAIAPRQSSSGVGSHEHRVRPAAVAVVERQVGNL
jgi:O-antigen ligase